MNRDAVITHRQYLLDARFGIILHGDRNLLERAAAALRDPVWGVWLGRKSCIPAAPVFAGLAAAALGARLLECHVVFSRECFGPDVPASITTAELAQLVEGVRFVERALSHPVDKEAMSRELAPMRSIFQKSLVAARDLPEGWVLREADLAVRKPGTGLPASSLRQVVNSRLKRALRANALLSEQDLER